MKLYNNENFQDYLMFPTNSYSLLLSYYYYLLELLLKYLPSLLCTPVKIPYPKFPSETVPYICQLQCEKVSFYHLEPGFHPFYLMVPSSCILRNSEKTILTTVCKSDFFFYFILYIYIYIYFLLTHLNIISLCSLNSLFKEVILYHTCWPSLNLCQLLCVIFEQLELHVGTEVCINWEFVQKCSNVFFFFVIAFLLVSNRWFIFPQPASTEMIFSSVTYIKTYSNGN